MIWDVIDALAPFFDLDLDALRRRRGVKWSRYPTDVLPAWVADMDFPIAPCIRLALEAAIRDGDLGYPPDDHAVADAFKDWNAGRTDLVVEPARTHLMPDVVKAIENVILATTAPGDGILVTTPVYPPFLKVIAATGRRLVESQLDVDGRIVTEDLEHAFAVGRPRIVLLCSPHNPTGTVFSVAELTAVARLAAQHDALVIADEIHADVVYEGHRHVPFDVVAAGSVRVVTMTSASKAFNLAGLRCALVLASDDDVHDSIMATSVFARDAVGTLGIVGALAAWSAEGREWLGRCLEVLDRNRRTVAAWASSRPGIGHRMPEATYLAWLDLRAYDLGPVPSYWLLREAKVALSQGPDFGSPGEGFARMNFATSPAIVEQILERIGDALDRRG
jgi:cystathionine beta-lyase